MGKRARTGGTVPDMPAADILESSPFEGDLEKELAARPPRRVKPSLTVYLSAGVLLVGGFAGGIQADKQWGKSNSSSSGLPAGLGSALRNGGGFPGAGNGTGRTFGGTGGGTTQGQGGQGGGFGGAGGATVGTVKLVDGTTVYVQTTSGIVAVKTTGDTKVQVTKQGTLKDLPPGATVVVQGSQGGDGSVSATTITEGSGLGRGTGGG